VLAIERRPLAQRAMDQWRIVPCILEKGTREWSGFLFRVGTQRAEFIAVPQQLELTLRAWNGRRALEHVAAGLRACRTDFRHRAGIGRHGGRP